MAFRVSLLHCVALSIVAHVALLVYGELHDRLTNVKFTDIDFFVFTDAADLVANGGSPFDRATYRYSPLFAWILLPGSTVLPKMFGKVLFCCTDIALGWLVHAVVRHQGAGEYLSVCCACGWLFNPMALVVSARGNAESVLVVLVLSSLFLVLKGRSRLGGLLLGLSVHLKIYPIIYAGPLYFALEFDQRRSPKFKSRMSELLYLLWPTHRRVNFVLFSLLGFALPTAFFYWLYGHRYIADAFLYHFRRHDIRHNFSPYFYLLYLTADRPERWVSLASFLPQAASVVAVAYKYCRPADLPFCLFLQTFCFVTFNKVCTSQYFLWYMSLFPLVYPRLRLEWSGLWPLALVWASSQAVWLFSAYALEFKGRNTFLHLWAAGLLFFVSNIYVINFLIGSYRPVSPKLKKIL